MCVQVDTDIITLFENLMVLKRQLQYIIVLSKSIAYTLFYPYPLQASLILNTVQQNYPTNHANSCEEIFEIHI